MWCHLSILGNDSGGVGKAHPMSAKLESGIVKPTLVGERVAPKKLISYIRIQIYLFTLKLIKLSPAISYSYILS